MICMFLMILSSISMLFWDVPLRARLSRTGKFSWVMSSFVSLKESPPRQSSFILFTSIWNKRIAYINMLLQLKFVLWRWGEHKFLGLIFTLKWKTPSDKNKILLLSLVGVQCSLLSCGRDWEMSSCAGWDEEFRWAGCGALRDESGGGASCWVRSASCCGTGSGSVGHGVLQRLLPGWPVELLGMIFVAISKWICIYFLSII